MIAKSADSVAAIDDLHLLVVIDFRMARIYKADFHGNLPQCIIPYDANGSGRHLHYVQEESDGQQRAERISFYDAVAKTLQPARKILLFGSGGRASSAMEQLLTELQRNHSDLAARVIGSIVVGEQHLRENQLLAEARAFYSNLRITQPRGIHETFN